MSVALARPPVPFRHGPPPPRLQAVRRPRLLEVLARRFDERVIVLHAAGGFGKSTLLAQAVAQNVIDPRGIDVWLGCGRRDGEAGVFLEGLATSLGIDVAEVSVEAVAAAVWRSAPQQVALILDDAHHLVADSTGAEALVALASALPGNGHLVLATRTLPRLPAGIDPLVVGDADLAFDEEELAAFAAGREVPVAAVAASGGWPAIAELRAGAGEAVAEDFLWEEVLGGLPDDRRAAVEALLPFGRFDDELVRVVTAWENGAVALANGLPLADVDEAAGVVRLHDLWPRATRMVGADEGLRAGADLLARRGQHRRAFDALGHVGDEAGQVRLLRRLSTVELPEIHVDDLAHLVASAPEDLQGSPHLELLRSQALLGVDGEEARAALTRAVDAFAAAGDEEGEVQALTRRTWLHSWEMDAAAMGADLARLHEFAERGSDTARRSLLVARAYAALVGGQPDRAVDLVVDGRVLEDPVTGPIGAFIAAGAELELGRPQRAVAVASGAQARATGRLKVGLAGMAFEAKVVGGLPDEATVRAEIEQLEALVERYGVAENLGHCYAGTATVCAEYGWEDEARVRLRRAREVAERVGARVAPALTMAEVVVALVGGDEAAAARRLGEGLAAVPFGAGPDRAYLRSIGIVYVLAPELRDELDARALGPAWAFARTVARHIVDLRQGADPAVAAELDWSRIGRLRAAVPLPCVVELATAAVAAGSEAAGRALDDLPFDVRPFLRRLAADGPERLRPTARAMLARHPAPPDRVVEVRVLGRIGLFVDGEPCCNEGWRRERVRSLLALLVDRRRMTRRQAAEALWPDLEPAAAADNLRVNLNHLQRVLQPERRADEPSWYLEVSEEDLALRPSPQLVVDVDRFEASIAAARAAEAGLDPQAAIGHYRDAVEHYGGDYLEEAPVTEWGEFDRTRLRAEAVAAAVRAGELLVAAGEPDEAERLAAWAVEREPFVEAAHRLAAAARRRGGDRTGAWRLLDSAVEGLRAEGLQPEPATLRLLDDLRSP